MRARGISSVARLGMTAQDWVVLAAISLTLGVCAVLGASYVVGQGFQALDAPLTVVLCVVATLAFGVLLVLFDQGFSSLAVRGRVAADGVEGEDLDDERTHRLSNFCSLSRPSRLERFTPSWSPRSIALFSLVMALFWLPWLIANYPGGTYWDTYYQIFQCYPENHPIAIIPYEECYDNTLTDAYLCDHHPIFDTLIYGAFGMASDALTGNWMAGVFAFVCLQGAAHVVAFTSSVAYLRERRCPVVLCFGAYVFLCVMPFVSTWALCMVKDSLFGLFYIPYSIMLFEAVRTRGSSLARPRAIVLFALVGVLLCLTKKTGLYVVVPTALIAAVVYGMRGRGRRSAAGEMCAAGAAGETHEPPFRLMRLTHSGALGFLVQAAVSLTVMLVVLPYAVFPLLNVEPGGKQEVLGPLFQQTARYVVEYADEVTEEERAAIDAVLEYDNLAEQYTFDFQDEVKYRFRIDATSEDIANYLRVWAAQGLRHPESYVAATMAIAGFYVAPTSFANIRMVTVDTHMGADNRYMLYNPDELDWLRNGMADIYEAIGRTPGPDLPLLVVLYVFWLPAALLYVAYRRHAQCGVLFVPALVLLAFCVIAPVFDARYCVPLFDGIPLLMCMVAVLVRERAQSALP